MLPSSDRTITDKTLLTRTQIFSVTDWQVNFFYQIHVTKIESNLPRIGSDTFLAQKARRCIPKFTVL